MMPCGVIWLSNTVGEKVLYKFQVMSANPTGHYPRCTSSLSPPPSVCCCGVSLFSVTSQNATGPPEPQQKSAGMC